MSKKIPGEKIVSVSHGSSSDYYVTNEGRVIKVWFDEFYARTEYTIITIDSLLKYKEAE